MKLSILVCHLPDREYFFQRLINSVGLSITLNQWIHSQWEIIPDDDPTDTIGRKRNRLLEKAKGDYVCFIDDDDMVSDNYIYLLFEGIMRDVDCCSLRGIIYEKNSPPRLFEHSLRYKKYETITPDPKGFSDRFYARFPNHLNCIKSSIAKQFKFPEKNHGEDTDWATQIHNSGLIKTEYYIDDVLYYYTPSDTRK